MFLIDTNVVSALRRPERHPDPTMWLQQQRPSDIFLSVVTIGEIERGIAQQTSQNRDFARTLVHWLERILPAQEAKRINWTHDPEVQRTQKSILIKA